MDYRKVLLDLIIYISQQNYDLESMRNKENSEEIDYIIAVQNADIRTWWGALLHS